MSQATTDYGGLDLPQLLELMHDPAVPDPVSWWPQTPGWWIVCAWLLALVALFGWRIARRYFRNQYRRDALAQLAGLEVRAAENPAAVAGEVALLLKRTALAAYPRATVAHLWGEQWEEFLCRSCAHDQLVTQSAANLATAAYRRDVDGEALIEPARRWVRTHRA